MEKKTTPEKTIVAPGGVVHGAPVSAVEKPLEITQQRVRQITAPLASSRSSGMPSCGKPSRDTGEQERLLPSAAWITPEEIRKRHNTPVPAAEQLCLGPVRPVLDEATVRATISFAHRELEEIRSAKENGNYGLALQRGANLWQTLFREQFDWPSYFFLAEVAARMCFLFDPLRDMEKIKPWQECLKYILQQFSTKSIEDRVLYYHFIVIRAINDFFFHVQRYLHALSHPRTKTPEEKWGFSPLDWGIHARELENLMTHRALGVSASAGDVAIQLGPRSDYLFSTVKHESCRMEAVSHGDRYRWDLQVFMRDRDSAIATMPLNPDMQQELAIADCLTMQYINTFWTPREQQTSRLVSSAEISRVRYAFDRGHFAHAKQLSDTLLSRFFLYSWTRETAELLFIRAQGFFVLAELLLNFADPRFLQEAKVLTGSNGNRSGYADHVIDDGLDEIFRALHIVQQMPRSGLKDFSIMCRSLILKGMMLKMTASKSLPQKIQSLAPWLFEICIHDLVAVDQTARSFTYLPRLAEAWHAFAKAKIIDFALPEQQQNLQDIANFARQSVQDLDREAEESDQGLDILLDDEGVPMRISDRHFDDWSSNRKRPHVPQAYSDRVRRKYAQVEYFLQHYRVT